MDIGTIYSPAAVAALQRAGYRFSPPAEIRLSLSTISDALDHGHDFAEGYLEVCPVEAPTPDGKGSVRFWLQIETQPEGRFRDRRAQPEPHG